MGLPPAWVVQLTGASRNYLRHEPFTIEPDTTAAIGKTTRRRLRVSRATRIQECRTGALARWVTWPALPSRLAESKSRNSLAWGWRRRKHAGQAPSIAPATAACTPL